MIQKKQVVVLLDSHAIIHRGFHALPDLATQQGFPTGALFGFLSILLGIIEQFKPDYIIATFDRAEKTFRHEAFSDYKGTRKKTDDALITQLKEARLVCEKLSIPVLDAVGFEADDILGTLVQDIPKEYNIVIASGDMDTLQLIEKGDRVKVFTLKKGIKDTVVYGYDEVVERYKFTPEEIPDYKALRGDTSDNIPGIRGIGEKTATDLIGQFHSIENMYKHLDELKTTERIKGLIVDGKSDAEFSKILATIRRDAPVTWTAPVKTFSETISKEAIDEVCKQYEFRSMPARFEKVIGGLGSVETHHDVSLATNGVFVEKKNTETDYNPSLHELRRLQIMRFLLDSRNIHEPWEEIRTDLQVENAFDAEIKLVKNLEEEKLLHLWTDMEQPLLPITEKMTEVGIMLDQSRLKKLEGEITGQLKTLEQEIHSFTGEINLQSPKQLGVALYETLGLKPKRVKKTKTGNYSTNEEELQKMIDLHPVVAKILEYRERQKLLNTYLVPLAEFSNNEESKIHPIYHQDGAATGRFSSEKPNIQNLPIKTELGREIRSIVIAPKGKKIIAIDYSQIELRVAAMLSGETAMIDIFKNGRDIHTEVAMRVYSVSKDEVTKTMRRNAKVINFGIIYGMGITALQKNLESTKAEAETFYKAYFEQFPMLETYFEKVIADARKKGYTETLFGRRRSFSEINSRLPFMRAAAERMAMNAPIQGTATADIIKCAMLDSQKVCDAYPGVFMLAQIHDELLFEVPSELVEEVSTKLKKTLEEVLIVRNMQNEVPLVVEVGVGDNWMDAK